jgi:predicted transcriptional regulator
MKHKEKLRIARRLITKREVKAKAGGVFVSNAWLERVNNIAQRVKRTEEQAKKKV